MDIHFRRPVYTGETIRCRWTTQRVAGRPDGIELEAGVVCRRLADGIPEDTVLEATVEGVVYDDRRH